MKVYCFIIALSISLLCKGQHYFALEFIEKDTALFNSTSHSNYLSQKAIDRRNNQGINISIEDFPLTTTYVDSVSNLANIKCTNKWFNRLVISMIDSSNITAFHNISFIQHIEYIGNSNLLSTRTTKTSLNYDYGQASDGIQQISGDCIHEKGYAGDDILIAVLDDGFLNVNNMDLFDHLQNQIVGTKNFVLGGDNVYNLDNHGTHVLSVLAGKINTEYVGSAPLADYLLVVTEDNRQEIKLEEYYWVAGVEYADSAGADLINSSLGYNEFDDEAFNYSISDIGTATSIVSQAAKVASQKGMIIFTSAGNEGQNPWKYLTFPADQIEVFTVGSVSINGNISSFSSTSPAALSYTKPNLCVLGEQITTSGGNNSYAPTNGTSFSSPLLCGIAACLWQALPDKSARELFELIEQQGDLYHDPQLDVGYGIPDFSQLCSDSVPLHIKGITEDPESLQTVRLAKNQFKVLTPIAINELNILDIQGRIIWQDNSNPNNEVIVKLPKSGVYFIQATSNERNETLKFLSF